jgi:hypothetical protein
MTRIFLVAFAFVQAFPAWAAEGPACAAAKIEGKNQKKITDLEQIITASYASAETVLRDQSSIIKEIGDLKAGAEGMAKTLETAAGTGDPDKTAAQNAKLLLTTWEGVYKKAQPKMDELQKSWAGEVSCQPKNLSITNALNVLSRDLPLEEGKLQECLAKVGADAQDATWRSNCDTECSGALKQRYQKRSAFETSFTEFRAAVEDQSKGELAKVYAAAKAAVTAEARTGGGAAAVKAFGGASSILSEAKAVVDPLNVPATTGTTAAAVKQLYVTASEKFTELAGELEKIAAISGQLSSANSTVNSLRGTATGTGDGKTLPNCAGAPAAVNGG